MDSLPFAASAPLGSAERVFCFFSAWPVALGDSALLFFGVIARSSQSSVGLLSGTLRTPAHLDPLLKNKARVKDRGEKDKMGDFNPNSKL
jgi:hypothetical protein